MTRTRILIVDDDRSIIEFVTELLDDEGYETASAADGRQALAALDQAVPDLVLLDMRMPVVDGWTFMEEMRARGITARVLVMTAAQNARQWAEEIEADGYIEKPFHIDELLRAVTALVGPRRGGPGAGNTLAAVLGRWFPPALAPAPVMGRVRPAS